MGHINEHYIPRVFIFYAGFCEDADSSSASNKVLFVPTFRETTHSNIYDTECKAQLCRAVGKSIGGGADSTRYSTSLFL